MYIKSMEELEKFDIGRLVISVLLSCIFFIIVLLFINPVRDKPLAGIFFLVAILAFSYLIAKNIPMYLYRIYSIAAILLVFSIMVENLHFLKAYSNIVASGLSLTFFAIAVCLVYLIGKKGNKVFRAKWESRFAVQATQVAAEVSKFKTCPYCAETILVEAKVCKHCGRDI